MNANYNWNLEKVFEVIIPKDVKERMQRRFPSGGRSFLQFYCFVDSYKTQVKKKRSREFSKEDRRGLTRQAANLYTKRGFNKAPDGRIINKRIRDGIASQISRASKADRYGNPPCVILKLVS